MTKRLYWDDPYMKECYSTVIQIEGNGVVLDSTCFSPKGGGLVSDTGIIEGSKVTEVIKEGDSIVHILAESPKFSVKSMVHAVLDWERRYSIMRMHTATHILSNVVNRETGALITGNSVAPDVSRVDFNLSNFDKAKLQAYIDMANAVVERDLPVKTYFMKREQALSIPGMVKLLEASPPDVSELRIVEIGDFDRQADGGVHVKRTSEIGKIVFMKAENKGKDNRRVYFTLERESQ
ncbi:MAG: alanyl-tRNA editing protein [Conexivisphaerales archaeon]